MIPGYTATESQVISEAQSILDSPQFAQLQNAYETGQSVTVNIGERAIQYVPGMPAAGMSFFGDSTFYLGPEAFSSTQELQQTVLHELYRLYTTESAEGVSGDLAAREAKAALDFASKAIKERK